MYKIPSDLQYFKVAGLDHDVEIPIKLPTKTLHYKVYTRGGSYFLYKDEGNNDEIFKILDITRSFVDDIVGYITRGVFPEVKSKEDLLKVIIALDKECIKKFGGITTNSENSDFKVGDSVIILPRDKEGSLYNPYYVDTMKKYAGKTAIIIDISHVHSCKLDIDGGLYHWPREALKPLENTVHKVTLKPESKSTVELNLFPTRKHYQLNFNY